MFVCFVLGFPRDKSVRNIAQISLLFRSVLCFVGVVSHFWLCSIRKGTGNE